MDEIQKRKRRCPDQAKAYELATAQRRLCREDLAIEGNPICVPTVDSDVEFELEPDDDDYKELNFNED